MGWLLNKLLFFLVKWMKHFKGNGTQDTCICEEVETFESFQFTYRLILWEVLL
jgi:hypothetical protein